MTTTDVSPSTDTAARPRGVQTEAERALMAALDDKKQALELTDRTLGMPLHLDGPTISQLRSGRFHASLFTLDRIAAAFPDLTGLAAAVRDERLGVPTDLRWAATKRGPLP